MRGYREGTRCPDLPEKSQNLEFLSNTGQDFQKNHKNNEPEFNVDLSWTHQQNAILWHLAGGPTMACFSGIWDPPSFHQLKNKQKQKLSELDPL